MKIAFCLISNRPDRMLRFVETLNFAMVKGHSYSLHLSYEKEFTKNKLLILKEKLAEIGVTFIALKRDREKGKMFNYGKARMHSISRAQKISDYMIICDDDFRFNDGLSTNHYKWTAGERYLDCIQYLEQQKSCACVYTKGYLGGVPVGRWILPMEGGFFETGLGIVVRGKKMPYKKMIADQFLVPGAGEDTAIAITAMMNGYYIAKALNVSVNKDVTKKIIIRKGKSKKNLSSSAAYDLKYIYQKGVVKFIAEMYGSYELGKRLPQTIIDSYRANAKNKNFIVMF